MPFAPFTVQCPTCSSRLRVTDPAVIGTIAACPKCQSMVQIDPPQLRVGASSVDSEAITEEAVPPGEFDPNRAGEEGTSIGSASPESGFSGQTNLAPPIEPPGTTLPMDWQSDSTRRTRQIAMVSALSIGTLLVAGVMFALFARSYRRGSDPDPSLAQAQISDASQEVDEPASDPAADPGMDRDKEPQVCTGDRSRPGRGR